MTPDLHKLWVYLAATPLLGLTATLVAYVFAYGIYQRLRFNPLANPVLIAVAILVPLLTVTGTPYKTYFDGAQFVHFLLGPATVALAVPLYHQWPKLRRHAIPLLSGLLAGSWSPPCPPSAWRGCSTRRPRRCARWPPSR